MLKQSYRKQIIHTWNEIAPRYHTRVKAGQGPFESTKKMLSMINIANGDRILDVACGTGAVSRELLHRVGHDGIVVGIDTSYTALLLAKKYAMGNNFHPVICDAEHMRFSSRHFDAATCQFGLFFFSNARKALKNIKRSLKFDGTLAITVHGRDTPFYTSLLDAIIKYIPEYKEPGTPDMTRFNTKNALAKQVREAGFSCIHSTEFTFTYSPGTFEQYWRNYLIFAPKASKAKIDLLDSRQKKELKEQVRENILPFENNKGNIKFPWQIVIVTAKNS
ncbi:MAG: type 11 methyltransferase [Cenarchaeum symbiont of Oopsacas minuta]|nr:type 11 methyltransferase [Cenarchaeum symbiont of Oopsacas minuta]